MSRSKFIVVAAASLAILPISASAISSPLPSASPTAQPVAMEGPREMTKAMMSKAFKNFSATLDSEEKTVHLAGVTSKECMDLFTVTATPDDASFRVEFKGGPADCLNHSKLKCEIVEDKSSCAKLSEKDGAKLDLDQMSAEAKEKAKDKKIVLVSKKLSKRDPYADIPQGVEAEENAPEQLTGFDVKEKKLKALVYTSEEVLKAEADKLKKKILQAKLDACVKYAADCRGRPQALEAIEYLEEHAEDTDDESIDDKYIAGLKHAQNAGELKILMRELNGIRATDSDKLQEIKDRMLELASQDSKLVPEVTAVLSKIAAKELTDPTSLTKDARDRQLKTLETLRPLLGEKEFAALEAQQNKVYFQRSVSEGIDSPNFKDALQLQMAQFNSKMIEAGCMSEGGQKVASAQCMQLESTIKSTDAFKEVQLMAKTANDIQTQINTRRSCEQGLMAASACQAFFQQQQGVLDPSVANANMIPNPFAAPVQTAAVNGQQQNGVIPNTGVTNQVASNNPFLNSALPANPFATQTATNTQSTPLSVFMSNGTALNTQQVQQNPALIQHQLTTQNPVMQNTGFAPRS